MDAKNTIVKPWPKQVLSEHVRAAPAPVEDSGIPAAIDDSGPQTASGSTSREASGEHSIPGAEHRNPRMPSEPSIQIDMEELKPRTSAGSIDSRPTRTEPSPRVAAWVSRPSS